MQSADDGQIRQDGAKKYMTDGFANKGFLMVKKGKDGVYNRIIKRILDIVFSFCGIVVLSPLLVILTVCGAVAMKGNPFFVQERPGWHEKIFKLIKFRTMSNEIDANGELLPDNKRINNYGKFLRASSCDELPQLVNILIGDMSIIGPRPQLIRDMVFMTSEQRRRHDVRPGLSGLAQVSGRNALKWENKLALDVKYVDSICFKEDVSIFFKTIKTVVKHENINDDKYDVIDFGDYLLKTEMVSKEEYDRKMLEATEILGSIKGYE